MLAQGSALSLLPLASCLLLDYNFFHNTLFVGLHGPRTEPSIPWPIGLESRAGIKATSVADAASKGPRSGYGEAGAGFQAAIVRMDAGVDPVEVLHLLLGFFFIDLTGDDF
jgi:hypothetical protein